MTENRICTMLYNYMHDCEHYHSFVGSKELIAEYVSKADSSLHCISSTDDYFAATLLTSQKVIAPTFGKEIVFAKFSNDFLELFLMDRENEEFFHLKQSTNERNDIVYQLYQILPTTSDFITTRLPDDNN